MRRGWIIAGAGGVGMERQKKGRGSGVLDEWEEGFGA